MQPVSTQVMNMEIQMPKREVLTTSSSGNLASALLSRIFLKTGVSLKEAAQINRDQTEDAADHERNAPGPVGKFRRRVDEVHQERNEGTEQNAAGDATREKADKGVLVAGRCVFMNEDQAPGSSPPIAMPWQIRTRIKKSGAA